MTLHKNPHCPNLLTYFTIIEWSYIDIQIFLNFNLISTPSVLESLCTIKALS